VREDHPRHDLTEPVVITRGTPVAADHGPADRARFGDTVAIVTGGGSGLGRATAVRLAAEGGQVAVLDVDLPAARSTADAIAGWGGKARAFEVDVSQPDRVASVVAEVAASLGRPQVLVNSAGIGQFGHTTDVAFETWTRTLAVNLGGTFLMCQATLPHLIEGGGSIVNIASNSGLQGIPYAAAYCASKGGVVLLTKSLAVEYSGTGVRINAVAPGGMVTPLLESFALPPTADATRLPRGVRIPHASPDEVASLVAYVASEDGRFMMGSIVSIDGGITA
jgi:NAD(P)-dependent dehydrogenase (short-subunit alcohol dehydrogenase family)